MIPFMEDAQLLRYSRQIMLSQIDVTGQQKLLDSRVFILGLGGLGSPAAMYLAAAGVGHLVLNDFDTVDLTNLQRQIAHPNQSIGQKKVDSARKTLQDLNPEIRIDAIDCKLEGQALEDQIKAADVVLDCSDNFSTRFAVNKACVKHKTPLVSGAAIRFEGQVSVFTPGADDSPCYNCLYEDQGELQESCVQNGVIAPLPGIIGSTQALEAIKLITNAGKPLQGRLLLLDGLSMEWNQMKLRKNPNCPTCSGS